MAIHTDLIDGATLRETEAGYEAIRVALVTGVTGDGPARLHRALTASDVPQRGDTHPSIPELQCDQREARPAGKGSNSQIRVTCTYRDLSGEAGTEAEIEIGAGVTGQASTFDAYGKLIVTRWTFAEYDATTGEIVESGERARVHTVERQIPLMVYRVRTRLAYSPVSLAREYVGTVSAWGLTEVPMWLCTNISGSSVGDGEYDVAFEFQYAATSKDGWLTPIPEVGTNGQPLPGGDVKRVTVYRTMDFRKLPVPRP